MAHRLTYSRNLNLPPKALSQLTQLQKQISLVRQKHQMIKQQNEKKLLLMENRLVYGKKKIFGLDRKMEKMGLVEQIAQEIREIQRLRADITREEELLRVRKQQESQMVQRQRFSGDSYVKEIDNTSRDVISPDFIPKSSKSKDYLPHNQQSISPLRGTNRRISDPTDPNQQLLSLTHETIRLKKSLQQVRSKYSDNFTQYRLRQQYQKLRKENQHIALQLKNIQAAKKIMSNSSLQNNADMIDYDQLQMVRVQKEYQMIKKQRDLLKEYLQKVENDHNQKKDTESKQRELHYTGEISKFKREIQQVKKNNAIIDQQIQMLNNQISRAREYVMSLRGIGH